MKLNLGCGYDVREGYVNVDFRPTLSTVMVVDLSVLPWPFEDSSADEILMLDFLEHFPYAQTKRILLECYRVLKSDGSLIVQVPDGEHLMNALAAKGEYLCNNCGTQMNPEYRGCRECKQTAVDISEAAMRRLYGGQDYPGNFHYTCFTQSSLMHKAAEAGLQWDEELEPEHQYKNWNFKIRFKKGNLW
jgi:predicted SAM-dependent methyltransferase